MLRASTWLENYIDLILRTRTFTKISFIECPKVKFAYLKYSLSSLNRYSLEQGVLGTQFHQKTMESQPTKRSKKRSTFFVFFQFSIFLVMLVVVCAWVAQGGGYGTFQVEHVQFVCFLFLCDDKKLLCFVFLLFLRRPAKENEPHSTPATMNKLQL